jgi:hypothetical protein
VVEAKGVGLVGGWPCWGREKRRKKRDEEMILGTRTISSPKWTGGDPADG